MAERGRPRNIAGLEAALVARHFYIKGKQKSEIADDFGISRFKVARLLDEARAAGMVHISVDLPTDIDVELGDRVAERWGIRRCLPAVARGSEGDDLTAIVAQTAARHLDEILEDDDVVGLSWGRTLTETVEAVARRSGADAVQLVGGIRTRHSGVGGAELVRRLAATTGGTAYPLNAPFVVGSRRMATTLRSEASLCETVARFRDVTTAVMGIGGWRPPQTAILDEVSEADRAALIGAGACADICGIVLDESGAPVSAELSSRVVGITPDELRRVPQRIAVASGEEKAPAVAAALRSRLVTTLVVDSGIALRLLEH